MKKEIRIIVPEEVFFRVKAQADEYGQKISAWCLQSIMEKVVSLEKSDISRKSLSILENLQKMES